MDIQISLRRTKRLALVGGLAMAFLLCGIPLLFFVNTGLFRQVTQPFANAAQTVVVVPVITDTPTQNVAMEVSPTNDLMSLPFKQRYEMANPYISEALNYSWQGNPTESILSWTKVLEFIPEHAETYYLRGQEYIKLLQIQRAQQEYAYYLSLAGADFEKAIELNPYYKGDYYLGRYKYYDYLSILQMNRVDKLEMQRIALDNLSIANRLGNYDPLAERYVIFSNILIGNCDEGIAQANHLIETEAETSAAFYTGLELGYMCKNKPEEALQYADTAISIKDTCERRLERARVLYALGRVDDALADMDFSIGQDPYYCGDRYYMRALLYAEKGELDKAQNDLNFGIGQTWSRGGLLSYALGKIALGKGDRDSAISYFQDAEVTYQFLDPVLAKIRDDLTSLGADPLEVTISMAPATAIPTPTPQPTLRPTSSPIASMPTPFFTPDPILQNAYVVDIQKSVGPIKLGWNTSSLWHFQPAQSLDHREVKSLSVWLISSVTSQRLPRQILLWNFRKNMWGSIDNPKWGENQAGYQNELVSQDGDVVIYFVNQDNTLETIVDTFGITLVLQRTDGSIEVHGITP